MTKTWSARSHWFRNRLIELAAAMAVVYVVTAALEHREDAYREAVLPEEWMEVHEVFVPDHTVGSDPPLHFSRTIRENFTGLWIAEVQTRSAEGFFANVCSGSGIDDYDTTDRLPEEGVSWSWYFGRPCVVPPGEYRVLTVWEMRRPGYPMKRLRHVSNVFEVSNP